MLRGAGCRGSLEACWWRVQMMARGRSGAGWIHAGTALCGLRCAVQAVHAASGWTAGWRGCQRARAAWAMPILAGGGWRAVRG